ncbi:MAG TPA: hypothetical protein VHM88_08210, partial [Candidatus Acidoferrales bacterium]|nr:hypothetical protein [Candidatus Acidoferrales bacterium]
WDATMYTDDQQTLGACVSFAGDHMRCFLSLQDGHPRQPHSQLWIYWQMRERFEGRPEERFYDANWRTDDTGAFGSWAEAIMEGRGFARKDDWPYDVTKLSVPPPAASYGPALWYKNVVPVTVPIDVAAWKNLLAAGHAFMTGYAVCQSFYQAQGSGNVPIPPAGDTIQGGHENFVMGYQDGRTYPDGTPLPAGAGGYFIFLNQWGSGPTSWFSPQNRLYVPYSFLAAPAPNPPPNSGWTTCVSDATCVALAPSAMV